MRWTQRGSVLPADWQWARLLAYISSTGTQSYTLPINAVARYARLWFANTGSTWKAVAEMRVFGAPTPLQSVSKYYFLGKQRVAMRQNGKLTYLHRDQSRDYSRWLRH